MTEELLQHWRLHEIDEEAVRHEAERARFPERRRTLAAHVAAERSRLDAHDAHAAQRERRRRELERDIASLEEQEKRFRRQLDAVTNQQQFEAVQHEIAGVAGKRSDLETEVLTLMEDDERAGVQRPSLVAALDRAERDAAATVATLDESEATLVARLAELDAARTAAATPLEPAARSRYERIRASRGGRAVAAIEKGACGGCFRAQPPHALQEARRADRL
ncbi:MAG TPA: hypothetical protein VMH61_00850, partial [Candidatus Acidoferrales bacterium]|nr:hypothetical protein [Candidatus Acidoferrales bacterium]